MDMFKRKVNLMFIAILAISFMFTMNSCKDKAAQSTDKSEVKEEVEDSDDDEIDDDEVDDDEIIDEDEFRNPEIIEYERPVKPRENYHAPAPIPQGPDMPTFTPEDAYEEGYNDGYRQGRGDGGSGYYHGANFDDSNNYRGYYAEQYESGYDNGYDAGYDQGEQEFEEEHRNDVDDDEMEANDYNF